VFVFGKPVKFNILLLKLTNALCLTQTRLKRLIKASYLPLAFLFPELATVVSLSESFMNKIFNIQLAIIICKGIDKV